jgi:undecaprenyl-phosphate galactose phosphotransferase
MDVIRSTADAAELQRHRAAAPGSGLADNFSIHASGGRGQGRSDLAKRAMDLVLTAALIGALAPAMLVVALLIRVTSGPRVLIRHERVGRGGVPFGCLKFRTMVLDGDRILAEVLARDEAARTEWRLNRKLLRDPRVTRIGRFLRRTSLDELPQLLNVLRGEMSLVGPRPVVQSELDEFYLGEAAARYRAVRPGLTGLWQVSGRSGVAFRDRVKLDMEYVRHGSLVLDIRILCRTPWAVLRARGAC